LFQQHPDNFDLVITDMTMPEMTGDRLVKKIIGLRPDFPVILCTGYSLRLDEESLDALEIRELLYKPFSQAQIGQAVRRALGVSAD
jgi:CheY-like chemotaxis protein